MPNEQEYLDRYNALLQEAEANYMKEVDQLHRKQYESLPEEKQYKGSRTVDELLQDMTDGRNGEFSVADSGFHVDVNALDKKMTPEYAGSNRTYKYKFKEVL